MVPLTSQLSAVILISHLRPSLCSVDSGGGGGECVGSMQGDVTSGDILLNNGVVMPVIGLGTAGLTEPQLVQQTVFSALQAGYRMIGNNI